MKYMTLPCLLLAIAASPVAADDFTPAMQDFLDSEASAWLDSDILVQAIRTQNAATGGYDQSQIDALDLAWRAEVGHSETPTITPVLNNVAADFLRQQVANSGGRITEVFVMDNRGLNVAASDVTSDYWQGDEAKFTETYGAGPGAVHFGDVEFDESSQTYQGQISVTISDPDTGLPIGAITIGVDAESLL